MPATYTVSTERRDPKRGVRVHGYAFRAPTLELAKRFADAADTWAVVTCVSNPGTILYENGKERAPWLPEQIRDYELNKMSPETVAGLKRMNERLSAAVFGGPKRRSGKAAR